MIVFLNGQFVPEAQAVIPVNDRGFLLGDGLFETTRVVHGRPFRFTEHLERLARGADFLKIKCLFTSDELQNFAGELIGKNKMADAILRLTLTRGPGGRGYAPTPDSNATVVMTLHPLPPSVNPAGWSLVTSSFRIPATDPLAAFKTTSKILHVMARAEAAERGADEALLLNTNDEVAETASGNLFWVQDDTICTVPAVGILPGIARAVVLEICRTLSLRTNQRAIKPDELKNCAGIFITQSVLGVVPVTTFDGKPVSPSPLVEEIARGYNQMLVQP